MRKIKTLHPLKGKKGVNINRAKYNQIKIAIIQLFKEEEEVIFWDLVGRIGSQMGANFERSINWYVTTVKLDLEARKTIARIPNSSPQRLRLIKKWK